MLFLSTAHKGDEFQLRCRKRPSSTKSTTQAAKRIFGAEVVKTLPIPKITTDYNFNMNSIDIGDQLRSSLGYDHRYRRGGWQAIAWSFLLEVALINSYLIQRNGKPSWKKYHSQIDWRTGLIKEIFKQYSNKGASRQRFRAGDTYTHISQHNHVNRGKRGPCLGCEGHRYGEIRSRSRALQPISGNRGRRGSMTFWGCDKCEVAICTKEDCWYFYHKLK